MLEENLLDYLEKVEDDFMLIKFLITEEILINSWESYNLSVSYIEDIIDSIEKMNEIHDEIQMKVLESSLPEESNEYAEELYNAVENDYSEIIEILDYNEDVKNYIATRLSNVNNINFIHLLFGMTSFSADRSEDAWYKSHYIKQEIYNKILNLNFEEFLFIICNCYDALLSDSYFDDAIISKITSMNDSEFLCFRLHTMYKEDLIEKEEIMRAIEDREQKMNQPLSHINNYMFNENNKLDNNSLLDYINLIDTNSYYPKNKINSISNNISLLLYMFANPIIFLEEVGKYEGEMESYKYIPDKLIKKFCDKIDIFEEKDIKLLLALTSCYENQNFNQHMQEALKTRIEHLNMTTCFNEKDLYIAKSLKKVANSISYNELIPSNILYEQYVFNENNNTDLLEKKLQKTHDNYNYFNTSINLLTNISNCSFKDIIHLLTDKKFYPYIEATPLLNGYIKYRILSEENISNIKILLLTDLSNINNSLVDIINTKLVMFNILPYNTIKNENEKKL